MLVVGEVIDDEACARRMLEAKEKGEPHFYMMELGGGLIIDARDRGNVSRLLNSSCCANATCQKWHDAGTGPCSGSLVHCSVRPISCSNILLMSK